MENNDIIIYVYIYIYVHTYTHTTHTHTHTHTHSRSYIHNTNFLFLASCGPVSCSILLQRQIPVVLTAISPAMLNEPVSQIFTPGSSTTSTSESVAQDVTCSEIELYSFHTADELLLVVKINICIAQNAVHIWLHWLSNREQPTLLKDTANCPHKNKRMIGSIWQHLIVLMFLTTECHNMHYFLFLFRMREYVKIFTSYL